MPSGAKRRKAAKKKKEKATNNPPGNDDLKTLDERESDGGEVSSPVSQDQHNQHHSFTEGEEEEEKRDTSSVRSFIAENKSMEEVPNDAEGADKIAAEDEGVVEIIRELKSDEDSVGKTVNIDYVESVKESNDGSSSSSSSDNESPEVEKNSEVAEYVKSKEEVHYPVLETAPFDVSVKQVNSLPEEVTTISEDAPDAPAEVNSSSVVETILLGDLVEPVVEEVIHFAGNAEVENSANTNDWSASYSNLNNESRDIEKSSEVVESVISKEEAYNPVLETNSFNVSVKPVVSLSEDVTTIIEDAPVGVNGNSVVETLPLDDSVKPIVNLSEEVNHVTESAPVENSVNSDLVELGSKENVEKFFPSLDENTGVPLAETDLFLTKNEDKVVPLLVENGGTSSSVMGFASKENGDKLLQSSNAPSFETRNGAEHSNDSEIPESSVNQPLVAMAPRTVGTTSWKSCCGLFELLTGTNR